MHWFALHLPRLPLEALPPLASPSAVVARERIVVGDVAAEAAGVVPGLRLSGAWGLAPALAVQEREPAREVTARQRLACALGRFTPEIVLPEDGDLLLEIGGSLRLFGGQAVLTQAMLQTVAEQGLSCTHASAPTPLAARWLAQAVPAADCTDLLALRAALAPLPLAVLRLPERDLARLQAIGATRLEDVLSLPRAGLARRFGTALVAQLARALGELPDPQPRFAFPEQFAQHLELPGRVEHAPALEFASRRLIEAMTGWLAARQQGIKACTLQLDHESGLRARPPTCLELGFSSATRDPVRIARVLSERLRTLSLPAPVEALRWVAKDPVPLPGESAALFGHGSSAATPQASATAVAALLERLRARLGEAAVHALTTSADHRPERASQPCPTAPNAPADSSHTPGPPRPLWLLPHPAPLAERDGRPQRHGPLELLAGPERIESGWWDSGEPGALGDVRRDYFIARNRQGGWLWIFRDAEGWFLHGVFA